MELRDSNGLTEEEFMKSYNPGDYPRPSLAADMVIFTVVEAPETNYRKLPEKELRVLLIKRGGHPFLGQWALPGGFVRPNETVGTAARRELEEETGVASGYLEQLYTFSEPGRDPRTWVVSCAHMALVDSTGLRLQAGDDAADTAWFRVSYTSEEEEAADGKQGSFDTRSRLELTAEDARLNAVLLVPSGGIHAEWAELPILDNSGLAFDHARIIACAMERLRSKAEYSDLVLKLMPERFTLTELQQVYEVILGKPLLKAAFRRKIKDLVCETGEYRESAGHRPSQLFHSFKP